MDTALEARVKVALASATGQHLCLDNELILAKLLGDILSLLRRESGQRLRRGDTVLRDFSPVLYRAPGGAYRVEQLNRLVLVDREVTALAVC